MIAELRAPFISVVCLLALASPTPAQTTKRDTTSVPPTQKQTSKPAQPELSEAQLPAFAVSLVISLANDARSYSNLTLRPRVFAHAAEVLWDADNVTARDLFKRAWESAEKADAEEVTIKTKDNPPAMVQALRRMSGRDLRFEVLNMIARRDRALAEEFFAKLKSEIEGPGATKKEVINDSWFVSDAVSKRLEVAKGLLKEGQTEKALEFAASVLTQVNMHTISFLSDLRVKNAEAADRTFAMLLARTEFDPAADANIVSGLSSYLFTPGLYVTFEPYGGTRWTQPDESPVPANVPVALRNKFFQVAASILLRPLPPAEQVPGSPTRSVKSNVIKRLLPLFEQYAPDTAAALRTQLVEPGGGPSRDLMGAENAMLSQGIAPEPSSDDVLQQMQSRLNRAKTARERDAIYAATVSTLLNQGDERARDLADKIEDVERRTQTRQYVDFEFVRRAIKKKAVAEALRLAQTGKLANTQRASAYIDIALLLREQERQRASELLEDAVREIRRIEGDKPDRAVLLVGVATQFIGADRVRAWEIMDEVVKEANRLEDFTGEASISFPLMTMGGARFLRIGGPDYSLGNAFRALAKDDLYRALDLAKSFKYEAAQAAVTIAIASSILQKDHKEAHKTQEN